MGDASAGNTVPGQSEHDPGRGSVQRDGLPTQMQFRTEVDWGNEIPLLTLTLSHSVLLASELLKTAQRRRHPQHDVTASEHLDLSRLFIYSLHVPTSPLHGI